MSAECWTSKNCLVQPITPKVMGNLNGLPKQYSVRSKGMLQITPSHGNFTQTLSFLRTALNCIRLQTCLLSSWSSQGFGDLGLLIPNPSSAIFPRRGPSVTPGRGGQPKWFPLHGRLWTKHDRPISGNSLTSFAGRSLRSKVVNLSSYEYSIAILRMNVVTSCGQVRTDLIR